MHEGMLTYCPPRKRKSTHLASDSRMVLLAYYLGMKHDIKLLVINGDLIATDQAALNAWIASWKVSGEINFEGAIGICRDLMKMFGNQFEQIHITTGNHDARLAKKTGGEVWLGMFLVDLPVKITRYDYLWLKTRRGYWHISHPKQYSSNSVGLGQRIYRKLVAPDGSKPHIVIAHTHQSQTGESEDGQRDIVASGCMRDPQRTKYIQQHTTTHHQWAQGLVMVKNGYLYNIGRDDDLEFWLGEDLYKAFMVQVGGL